MASCDTGKLIDLIVELSTSTVKALRSRARLLRDRHGLKDRFRGLWKLRKNALVRLLAEVELELMNQPSAEEDETMLLRSFEALVAKHTIQGVARGLRAVGEENAEQFKELMTNVAQEAMEGQEVFANAPGIAHNGQADQASDKPTTAEKAPQDAKKATKKQGQGS